MLPGKAKQRLVRVTVLKLLTTAAIVDNLAEMVDEWCHEINSHKINLS